MKLLIDIGHPAHVHLFKYVAWEMERDGHEVLFTCREKEVVRNLLDHYKFRYISLGKHRTGTLNKFTGLIRFDMLLLRAASKFKPDILLSHGSFYAAHVAAFLRKPHISLEDTGNMEQIHLYRPFTRIILTPSCFHKELGKKQFRYRSYHELAYLHPNHFSPDKAVASKYVNTDSPYFLLRFARLGAHHDRGVSGITDNIAEALVKELKPFGNIYVTSERALAGNIEKYRLAIKASDIHHVMAFARMFIGDSQTMAAEAGVLGVPFIRFSGFVGRLGYLDEIEKHYKLGIGVRTDDECELVTEVKKMLKSTLDTGSFRENRERLIREKIDLAQFLTWFIQGFPGSRGKIINDQDYR